MKTFHSSADDLRALLDRLGASYDDFGAACGVTPAAVAGWVSGRQEIPRFVELLLQAAQWMETAAVQSAIWGAASGFSSSQQRESWRKHMRLTAAQAAKIFGLSRQTWLHGGELTDRRVGIILSLLKRREDQWEVVQSWIEKESQ